MEVVITHISLNSAGGGELVCLSLIEALRSSGNQVTLVTVDRTDWMRLKKTFGRIILPNQQFYLFSRLSRNFETLSSALLVFFFWIELFLIRLFRRSHLMINTCGEKVNVIADIAYFNGIALRCAPLELETDAKRRCIVILYSLFSKIFDKFYPSLVVVNSKFIKALIEECLKTPALVVYPPVNLREFCNIERKKKNIAVTYSQYVPTQNLSYVPEIAGIAKQASFVIIGPSGSASNKTLQELRRTISHSSIDNRVTLLVNQPFQKYVELLSDAKIFLRTLKNEPFGMSVVEAMAAGCVPVVPRDGGPWFDILDQKQGEYGYSYRSVEEAANLIRMLLENDDLREEVSARAAKRAMAFDSSVFERKILRVVEEVYSRKSARLV